MKECAFCSKTDKMTGEHIFSDWMNDILAGPWIRAFNSSEGPSAQHDHAELDWTRKVVCETCNTGWMSDIEYKHAQPIMGPLIAGEIDIPINQSNARSIALFAFKTAVIVDTLRKNATPFFSRRIRNTFRTNLSIPLDVNIWICAYATGTNRADMFSTYYKGKSPFMGPLECHVCTYGVGCLAFQVVTIKSLWNGRVFPANDFDKLSVPLWPNIPLGFVWPPRSGALFSVEQFIRFHRRWENCVSAL